MNNYLPNPVRSSILGDMLDKYLALTPLVARNRLAVAKGAEYGTWGRGRRKAYRVATRPVTSNDDQHVDFGISFLKPIASSIIRGMKESMGKTNISDHSEIPLTNAE